MKACSVCKVRQPDVMLNEGGACADDRRCIDNQMRARQQAAELYAQLVSVSQPFYNWQKRVGTAAMEGRLKLPMDLDALGSLSDAFRRAMGTNIALVSESSDKALNMGLAPLTNGGEIIADMMLTLFMYADALRLDLSQVIATRYICRTQEEP